MKLLYIAALAVAALSIGLLTAPAGARVRQSHGVFTNGHHTITRDNRLERQRGLRTRDTVVTCENGRGRSVHDARTREPGLYTHERDVTGPSGRTRSVDSSAERTGEDTLDRKSTRLNSSHIQKSRMPSSA